MEPKAEISKKEKLAILKKQLLRKVQGDTILYPLSYGQKALWFLYHNAPESSSYNVAFTCRIISELNISALRRAFQRLINRHPTLRTTYIIKDGKPFQQVDVYQDISFEVIDASNLSEEVLKLKVKETYNIPFNLEKGPVFKVHLFQITNENFVLLINMHHIANDGWSLGIILNDVKLFYSSEIEGTQLPLPQFNLTYIDYINKQEEMLSGSKGNKLWNYWKEQLSESMTNLNLSFDKLRPTISSNKGSMVYIELDNELTNRLRELSRSEGVTLYTFLISSFLLLLHRYTNQNDILIGTTTAGRNFADTEGLIGYLVNPVVIRAKFDRDQSFKTFLNQIRKTVLGALEHQDFPFPMLVEKLMPVREADGTPIFQVEFGLYKIPKNDPVQNIMAAGSYGKQVDWGNLKVEHYEMTQQEGQFDLMLELAECEDRISGYFKYSTDLFEEETIVRMSKRFKILLNNILENPNEKISKLKILTKEEEHQILKEWNNTKANYPNDKTIHQLFEKQVKETPENISVVFGDKKLTYVELNNLSNSFASYLRKNYDIQRNDLVCVILDKSEFMIVTLLATLKSGGAYVPIDPSYPLERINYILENSRSKLIITTDEHKNKIDNKFKGSIIEVNEVQENFKNKSSTEIENINEPDDIAYIIYTSGTTGNPKGCMITHRNVVRLMINDKLPYDFNSNDIWIMAHSFCFDFSVWEMYGALLYGGKLIVPEKDEVRDVRNFLSLLKENKVTVLNQTPLAFYNLVLEEKESGQKTLDSHLRYVIFGGDKIEPQKLKDWTDIYSLDKVQLINMYGITETTVHVTFYRLKDEDINSNQSKSPIGKPIPETTVYVFDDDLNLVPVGVKGEFYIGGIGVSKGYLFRDALTAERFINNPYKPEEKIYKTGDEGFWLPDGNLEYAGRKDNQVKIRGFRIELGEIENCILNFHNIKEAVVLAREEKAGDKRLVAYIVFDKISVSSNELRQFLKEKLPDYMVPSSYIFLKELPVSSNGKIDKKVLANIDITRNDLEDKYVAPQTKEEEVLAEIWEEIICINKVGVHDNFFELGGDSILSIQIISKANQAGLKITSKQIFQYQTIAELADVAEKVEAISSEQGIVTGEIPLTPIEHWFFEKNLKDPNHYNHAVLLEVPSDLKTDLLKKVTKQILIYHDALRIRFENINWEWNQRNEDLSEAVPYALIDLSKLKTEEQKSYIEKNISELNRSLNLKNGPMIQVRLFYLGPKVPSRLLIIIHHLAVDVVSWRILLNDFYNCYQQLNNGKEINLPSKTTSFKHWSYKLNEYANSVNLKNEFEYWSRLSQIKVKSIPKDYNFEKESNTIDSSDKIILDIDEATTSILFTEVMKTYNTQINDILLTALLLAYKDWSGEAQMLINLEGHGREELFESIDLSRTVGWFTSIFPFFLNCDGIENIGDILKYVKETIRNIPNRGIGYGIWRYLNIDEDVQSKLKSIQPAEIIFNYLGKLNQELSSDSNWKLGEETIILNQNNDDLRDYALDINGIVIGNKLKMNFIYSKSFHERSTIEALAKHFEDALHSIVEHCKSPEAGGYTPSDFSDADLNQEELDNLISKLNG